MEPVKGFVQIAQNIVKTVSETLPFPISLSDEKGFIIGDSNLDRVGTFHPAYKQVIDSNDFITFDKEDVIGLHNVLPGIAVPLTFKQEIVGVLGIIGPPEEVRPHAELTKHYVELMWQETYYKQLADLEAEMEETYLQYLLFNDTKNEARTIQYCKELQIDTEKMSFCIIVTLSDFLMKEFDELVYSFTLRNLKEHLINEVKLFFKSNQLMKVNFLNKGEILLLLTVSSEDEYHEFLEHFYTQSYKLLRRLKKHYDSDIYITVGKLADSIFSIHESYQEAEHLLLEYEQLNSSRNVLSYHDWDVMVDLLPNKIDQTFKKRVLFRLNKIRNDKIYLDIMSSFIAYCESGMNITGAANTLYIHRNTVIYRLNKLEEMTSIDIKNFQHCVLLYSIVKNSSEIPGRSN